MIVFQVKGQSHRLSTLKCKEKDVIKIFLHRSSSDGNAICYVLNIFWMTSCFHILEPMGQTQARRYISSGSSSGGTGEKSSVSDCILSRPPANYERHGGLHGVIRAARLRRTQWSGPTSRPRRRCAERPTWRHGSRLRCSSGRPCRHTATIRRRRWTSHGTDCQFRSRRGGLDSPPLDPVQPPGTCCVVAQR